MITVVVRVWMPDRPGALGQVATRIGAVRGDVLGIEILEQGAGRVVDEVTATLPDEDLIPLLTNEVGAVDGVSVESIRIVADDRVDPSLAALAAAAAIAESPVTERLGALCDALARIVEADWVVVLDGTEITRSSGESPDVAWVQAFLAGSQHLDGLDDVAPNDLVWANLIATGLTVAAGRADRPIHERERVRFNLLARLADALLEPVAGIEAR